MNKDLMINKNILVNDFNITFSTVNGSGSATANNTILKAIFKMGIPAAGRNVFPSNIQGLPTWYSIRVSDKGYLGRKEKANIVVCMNKAVVQDDLRKLDNGGLLLIDSAITLPKKVQDIEIVKMPVDEILKQCNVSTSLKIYLSNMVYVGVVAKIIGIDLDMVDASLKQHFDNRQKAVDPNMEVIRIAYDWADKNIKIKSQYKVIAPKKKASRILIDGNTAAALGALYGGLQFTAWYPITPATSIPETINEYIPQLRYDKDSNNITCVVIQAEDELASIGMVVGAGWAGLRSMTATSGPGLCLMSEFLGLAYYAEIPVVVWDVQRVGPSTGLPTRTSQGDLAFAYNLSHGDTDFIILLPGNVKECFEFGWKALDLAEQFQMPVLVLSDLELGMNEWVSEDFTYPDTEINRGKVLWEEDLEKLIKEGTKWGRYLDLDNDSITYRTFPGNMHPKASYFTRGTGHDDFARYSENPENWEKNLDRLKRKFRKASDEVPQPILININSNSMGIISYGSSDMAVKEAIDLLNLSEINADYLRICSLPINSLVKDFIDQHEKVFIVEANRDGQMRQILTQECPEYAQKFISIAHIDGLSLSAEWIERELRSYLSENNSYG